MRRRPVPAPHRHESCRHESCRPARVPLVAAGILAVALVGAACSGTTRTQVATREPSTTVPASTTTTTEARGPEGSGRPVRIAFAGDSSFEGLSGALSSNPRGLLSAVAPLLSDADVTLVNLEAALGTAGSPQPKAFTFRVPAAALDALEAAGVDAVSMANNHGMDYGAAGLADSLAVERSTGFPVIGVGEDEDAAYQPYEVEVSGQRIAVVAANDVFDDPLRAAWTAGPGKPGIASAEEDRQDRLAEVVREVRTRADTVAVFLHYGTEKQTCPNSRQQDLVRLLVDAGADIVVGGHPHRVQGAGFLGGTAVAYSLGNFIFPGRSAAAAETGVLVVTATGRRVDKVEWRPAAIRGGVPYPLTGASADAALRHMDELRGCAGLTAEPVR